VASSPRWSYPPAMPVEPGSAAEVELTVGDGDTAGRMCWALWLFWRLRSRLVVGGRLTEEALQLDMKLQVAFVPMDEEISLPLFKPAK